MPGSIVMLSGPVGAGKSAIAVELAALSPDPTVRIEGAGGRSRGAPSGRRGRARARLSGPARAEGPRPALASPRAASLIRPDNDAPLLPSREKVDRGSGPDEGPRRARD
jgi:energy-coupling factor transporter ATP-binding protein EcfA2